MQILPLTVIFVFDLKKFPFKGQKIRFAIVNEQAAATPQFQNQQRRDNLRGGRRRGNAAGGGGGRRGGGGGASGGGGRRIRSDSGQSSRTYSRFKNFFMIYSGWVLWVSNRILGKFFE